MLSAQKGHFFNAMIPRKNLLPPGAENVALPQGKQRVRKESSNLHSNRLRFLRKGDLLHRVNSSAFSG
jgi:hypothetical protein